MPDHPWSNPGREWETTHVPEQTFLDLKRRYPGYSGNATQYREEHAGQYGKTERLAPSGSHIRPNGSHEWKPSFPRGSSRERDHEAYKQHTEPSNQTQKVYQNAYREERLQFKGLDKVQRTYYEHTSKGLTPAAHARLLPHARRFDELSNA